MLGPEYILANPLPDSGQRYFYYALETMLADGNE